MGPRVWLSAIAGVAAGSAAALVVAPFEVWAATRGSGRFGAALLLALGLYLPLGAGLGAFLGGLGAAWASSPLGSWRTWFATLSGDRARDRQLAAALLAGASCLLLEVLAVDAFARGPAAGMANARLAALSTGLVAAGVVVLLGIGLFVPLWRLALPLARWAPRTARVPAAAGTSVVLLLVVVAAGLLVLGRLDWRVLRVAPWIALGALFLLTVGGLIATPALRRRVALRRRWALGLWALMLPVALVPTLGQREVLVAQLQSGGALLPALIDLARALRDRDGDGYSAWLAGGDCDDRDPRVHPGARDLPGNGLDENCVGGDARPQAARVTAGARTAAARAEPVALVRNLLVICIDTLRADVLGVGGHPGGLTPTLDRLARSGAYFARAYAQGPNTPQSFPSIFTSQYPSRVPFVDAFTGYPELKPEALSVFEVLQRAGLRTEAVSSHFYFEEKRGIRQGVQQWDNAGAKTLRESNKDISAPRIVPRALARLRALEALDQPFVLFVHLFEPHSTYVPHAGVRYRQRGVAGLREKYDQEVAFVDAWLGRLLAALDASKLRRDTAILLFSDHGEAFGEHKFYFHGQALYDEVLHVPLILVAPGLTPRTVNQPVALLDVAPTLVELVGLAPPPVFQGRSLLRLARGQAARALDGRPIGAVLLPYPAWPKGQQALRIDHYKALLRLDENRFELYDLARDPREERDLALGPGAVAQRIRQQLAAFAETELQ
ncbi:MAG: sulfatase-like hydrolase/transferase [Proteobacteria bacterium]|nr:sulfatase-like hydrolase/transferase [Pseudomonadota bacterium]